MSGKSGLDESDKSVLLFCNRHLKKMKSPLDCDTVLSSILAGKERRAVMENLTISQVSRMYGVTPRMLRHYEKLGLIKAGRREDYAYRMYDEEAVQRLQQIIILRKLRLSLKEIAVLLEAAGQDESLRLLQNKLAEMDDEIASLELIRKLLNQLVGRLDGSRKRQISFDLLEQGSLREIVRTLAFPKTTIKENASMEELNRAGEILDKSLSVRILRLPPFTVASYHYIGENPEEEVGEVVSRFVQESGLYEKKPDARMFGFNHPNPGVLENGIHGYEDWVTIPEDMEVKAPMEKKKFAGGLYAVLSIPFPEFQLWENLSRWVDESPDFAPDFSELGEEIMGGCLEEHLNWVYAAHCGWKEDGLPGQIDLMLPIKRREK